MSCERPSDVTEASIEEQSPIEGVWKCEVTNLSMSLTFKEKDVEFDYYIESFKARAKYFGTYTINDTVITLNFDSIKAKKVTHPIVEYTAPENMPKEAVLYGDTAIVYLQYTFKRSELE